MYSGQETLGKAYHAIIARGRLVIADFKAGFLVGKAAGPARAGSGLEGDL